MSDETPKTKVEQIEEKLNQPNPATEPQPEHKSQSNTTSILGEHQSEEDLMRILGIIK